MRALFGLPPAINNARLVDANRDIAHAPVGRTQLFKYSQQPVTACIEANRIEHEIYPVFAARKLDC